MSACAHCGIVRVHITLFFSEYIKLFLFDIRIQIGIFLYSNVLKSTAHLISQISSSKDFSALFSF
jgi:hypothetical protein